MFFINSKAAQIQYRSNITANSIAGKLVYGLKILFAAQYTQEKLVTTILESTTAWKTLPQTPFFSVLRTRRLPFSSIFMVSITLAPGTIVHKKLKTIPLEKFIGDDMTYSFVAIWSDKDPVGYIPTKSNIKPTFLFITDGLVKYEQGREDGRRFYWNQDESLSD